MKNPFLRRPLKAALSLVFFSSLLPSTLSGQIGAQLTSYWSFDNTLADTASGLPDNASTTNDTLNFQGAGVGYGEGLFGGAGYTGNGNGHAEVNDTADIDAAPGGGGIISISLWTRVNAFDTNWQTIISKGENDNYRIARRSSSTTVAFAGGNDDLADTSVAINNGTWHHIAATAGPSGSYIYIDGTLVASNTNAADLTNSNNPLFIGNNPDQPNRQWNGEIDDVALWHRELSAEEVTEIFNAGTNGFSLGSIIGDGGFVENDDRDEDGLLDEWEIIHGLSTDPQTGGQGDDGASGDPDEDFLSNLEEFNNGTSPVLRDTDGDGLWDGSEVNTHNTDPTVADSDGDGSPDGEEVLFATDPNDASNFPSTGQTASGIQSAGNIASFLDGTLPTISPSAAQNTEENWNVENAFPNLSFSQLKGLVSEPRSTNLHIIERRGSIQMVDVTDPDSQREVFDISSNIVNGDNGGLRSVVFHPEFNLSGSPNRNYMYCFYSTRATTARGFTDGNDSFFYRLSRFTRNEASGNFLAGSELVLIQQRSQDRGQHFGGSLGFDIDGFLIIGWGDMEFDSNDVDGDFYQDAQRIDRIFQAAILRIDVDNQGGTISQAPDRTLQGNSGPNAVAGTTQACLPGHPYYHADNFSGRDYMVPSNNYFIQNPPAAGDGNAFVNTPAHGPALQEHQGLGTRNPWRLAIDPVDGDTVFFNVGSNSGEDFEEVELLSPGYNGGWPYLEGESSQTSETGRSRPPSQYAPTFLGNETTPLVYWDHSVGRVASGGVFYRGTQWPSIDAQLIFADQITGRIFALDYKSAGAPSANFTNTDGVRTPSNYQVRELLDSSVGVRQMAAGPTGQEIYMAGGNQIFRLFNSSSFNPEPPALLSQTGAFTDLTTLTPREGLIPFEPASELWSDRAAKKRWIAVPNQDGIAGEFDLASEKITYSETGEWAYPIGTVFIKHFALPNDLRDPDNPAKLTPVETRFSIRGTDGEYFFFTYRWRADGSDADLISDAETGDIPIISLAGSSTFQTWEYPSRAQCFECHQGNSGSVLGMKTRQLNHDILYPSSGETANQLTTLATLGLFDQSPDLGSLSSVLQSVSIDDTSESWELRVRSYLDSNCSYCHRPGSEAGRAQFDALLTTPLELSNLIDALGEAGNLGATDARIVAPGSPERSILYLRDSSTDPDIMMPPVGRTLNDNEYLTVLEAWIGTMGLTEYIAWAGDQNIDTGLSGDADGDGFLNVFEFTFLQNGQDSDLSNLPRIVAASETDFSISIPISGAALTDGFQVAVEGSADLINWYPISDPQSGLIEVSNTSAPGTDGVLEVQIPANSEKQFIRYGVVIP